MDISKRNARIGRNYPAGSSRRDGENAATPFSFENVTGRLHVGGVERTEVRVIRILIGCFLLACVGVWLVSL